MAFMGMSAAIFSDRATLERDVGPVRMRSFTECARTPVAASGIGTTLPLMMRFGVKLLRARVDGSYRRNPFFNAGTSEPVATPAVVVEAERQRLRAIG